MNPAPKFSCPDCVGRFTLEGFFKHDSGCPIDTDIEAISDADRAWFEAHPGKTTYTREMTRGEISQLLEVSGLVLPEGAELLGETVVEQVRPGYRLRTFRPWIALGARK